MPCCYGDDKEEYRRWEDSIKMDLEEVGLLVSGIEPSGSIGYEVDLVGYK